MTDKQAIEQGARDTIQAVTGTPPDQLRGLSPQDALSQFAARQMAIQAAPAIPADSTVTSTITVFPPNDPKTNEQPMSVQPGIGGDSGGGGGAALTARYTDVSGGTPVAATGMFLTP